MISAHISDAADGWIAAIIGRYTGDRVKRAGEGTAAVQTREPIPGENREHAAAPRWSETTVRCAAGQQSRPSISRESCSGSGRRQPRDPILQQTPEPPKHAAPDKPAGLAVLAEHPGAGPLRGSRCGSTARGRSLAQRDPEPADFRGQAPRDQSARRAVVRSATRRCRFTAHADESDYGPASHRSTKPAAWAGSATSALSPDSGPSTKNGGSPPGFEPT